jgi:hypothetical protein
MMKELYWSILLKIGLPFFILLKAGKVAPPCFAPKKSSSALLA